MRINPRQVEAFRNVMMTGGMTPAADLMRISQPAVSRLVKDFEAELGLRLFERDGNRLVPRQEAVLLYREVERLYVGLDHIGRIAENIRAGHGGSLRVGAVASLTTCFVEDVAARFHADFPGVLVTFETERTTRVQDLVAMHHYDVGLIYANDGQSGVRHEPLGRGPAVCVVPFRHPLASLERIDAADLGGHPLLMPGRRTPLRSGLDARLRDAGLGHGVTVESSLFNCCRMTIGGSGIAVVDPLTALEFVGQLEIRPFEPAVFVDYEAILPYGAASGLLADRFVAMMRASVEGRLDRLAATARGGRSADRGWTPRSPVAEP